MAPTCSSTRSWPRQMRLAELRHLASPHMTSTACTRVANLRWDECLGTDPRLRVRAARWFLRHRLKGRELLDRANGLTARTA